MGIARARTFGHQETVVLVSVILGSYATCRAIYTGRKVCKFYQIYNVHVRLTLVLQNYY